MYRFFIQPSQIQEGQVVLTGDDVNHIKNVLRMKIGDEIYISDEEKYIYTCQILEMEKEQVVAKILFKEEAGVELPSKIYLFQGLPKADKMELIIQKAVELGAAEIIPVAMKRCVVKLDAKKEAAKRKRWQSISESAAKQSKRMYVPEVSKVMSFKEALAYASKMDLCLIPYEQSQDMEKTRKVIDGILPGKSVAVFIGPEGGFEKEEVDAAMELGMVPITLGRRILRTETAGLAVLSVLMYHLEQ